MENLLAQTERYNLKIADLVSSFKWRYQYQDFQEFKGNKKCVGMFDHQRDMQNLSVLSVIYGNGVTRIPLSYSGSCQNFSAVELNPKKF